MPRAAICSKYIPSYGRVKVFVTPFPNVEWFSVTIREVKATNGRGTDRPYRTLRSDHQSFKFNTNVGVGEPSSNFGHTRRVLELS